MQNESIFKDIKDIKYVFEKGQSNYLIIVFSAFNNSNAERQHSYNYMKTLKNLNCNKLYILDSYGERGCYYLGENRELDVEFSVFTLIHKIIYENMIPYQNIIAVGSSKGGTAALYYGLKYNFNYVIAGAPQTFIGNYITQFDHTKSTAEYILGKIDSEGVNWANNLLYDLIDNRINTKINILSSEGDWQYKSHVRPFIEKLNEKNVEYILDMGDFKSHGDVGVHFKEYLPKKIIEIINNTEFKLDFKYFLKEGTISCKVESNYKDFKYAFYVMEDGNKVETKWYSKLSEINYKIPNYRYDKKYKLIIFIKDKKDNKIIKEILF